MRKEIGSDTLVKKAGLKATSVRCSILDILRISNKPLSAADVASRADADVASVYRNLNSFAEAGLIDRLMIDPDRAYFEYIHDHHHHLVCTGCGTIAELPECWAGSFKKFKMPRSFAKVSSHKLEFFGLCRMCHNA